MRRLEKERKLRLCKETLSAKCVCEGCLVSVFFPSEHVSHLRFL